MAFQDLFTGVSGNRLEYPWVVRYGKGARVTEVIAGSPVNFNKATEAGIERTSRTLRNTPV